MADRVNNLDIKGKQFSDMSPEERKEAGRIGGIASGKSKRKKKAMRETLDVLLSMPMKSGKYADVEEIKNFAAIKGKNISVQEAIIISMIQKAMKGDIRAAEWVRDTSGQHPSVKVETDFDKEINITIDYGDKERE